MVRQGGSFATVGEPGGLVDFRFVQNIDHRIHWDYSNIAPLLAFLRLIRGRSKPTKNFKFEFQSRKTYQQTVTADAAAGAAGNVSFGAADFGFLRERDLLHNIRTEEVVRVEQTPQSAGLVQLTRGYAGTTPAAVQSGDTWRRLANAVSEWSDVGDLIGSDPTKDFNYVQTVRDPFGASNHAERIANAGGLIGPSELQYLEADTLRDHKLRLESTLILGQRSRNGRTYTTAGMKHFLTAPGSDAISEDVSSVAFTRTVFHDYIHELAKYSPSKRWLCFCGLDLPNIVDDWQYSKVQIDQNLRKFGLFVTDYICRHGTIKFIPHPLFSEMGWDNEAWFIDPECIQLRGFKGLMDSVLYKGDSGKGMQGRGVDAKIYEYRTTVGLQMEMLNRCGRLSGIGDTMP